MKYLIYSIMIFFWGSKCIFASEPPCYSWQFKVSSHTVNAYTKKDGARVTSHDRGAYCKERWNGADYWGEKFKSRADYKNWKSVEVNTVLKLLSSLPIFFQTLPVEIILRSEKSTVQGNPASSRPEKKEIILYDDFFKQKNQLDILVHEFAHVIYTQNKSKWGNLIFKCSGWDIGKPDPKARTFPLIAPKKVIREDSKIGLEEDFANHFEKYFANHKNYKSKYPDCYNVMKEILSYEKK